MSNLDKFFRPYNPPPDYQPPQVKRMTCDEVIQNLRAYLRRDPAIAETFWSIDTHVRLCTSCQAELRRIQDSND